MKSTFRIILLGILLTTLLSACAAPAAAPTTVPTVETVTAPSATAVPEQPAETATTVPPTAEPTGITVTDALNREVVFDKIPERIVIAGKATTLLVNSFYFFPEADQRVLGVERRMQNNNDFMPLISSNSEDKNYLEMDASVEQILPLQPDVVVLKSYMKEKLGASIETAGVKVIYLDLETPEQFSRDITVIGDLLGNPARAEEINAWYKASVEQITSVTASLAEDARPKVLLLQYSDKGGQVAFNVPPASWLQTTMVELAGGNAIWKNDVTGSSWQTVTLEQIAVWNPDQIYIIDYKAKAPDVVAKLLADPQWQAMDAVKNGTLYPFPADFISWDQPDPRWSLGLEWLAKHIQPELFGSLDMNTEVIRFYGDLYGIDEATVNLNILPLLNGYDLFSVETGK